MAIPIQDTDLATGKKINTSKPEEKVRQEYEEILHKDYEYSYEQMKIEVANQRGEQHSKKNKERADILIYKTTDKTKRNLHEDVLGIVETKKPTKKEGIIQLKSYILPHRHNGVYGQMEMKLRICIEIQYREKLNKRMFIKYLK